MSFRITLIGTGGTIDKTYNEIDGSLNNHASVMNLIVQSLQLPDLDIIQQNIIFKDSLDMNEDDREIIMKVSRQAMLKSEAIVILHGTDTLEVSGDFLYRNIEKPACPIIFTGAMRPFIFKDTDSLQNVTEAFLAARLLPPGIYCVMHNRVLEFPGVHKDRKNMTFYRDGKP